MVPRNAPSSEHLSRHVVGQTVELDPLEAAAVPAHQIVELGAGRDQRRRVTEPSGDATEKEPQPSVCNLSASAFALTVSLHPLQTVEDEKGPARSNDGSTEPVDAFSGASLESLVEEADGGVEERVRPVVVVEAPDEDGERRGGDRSFDQGGLPASAFAEEGDDAYARRRCTQPFGEARQEQVASEEVRGPGEHVTEMGAHPWARRGDLRLQLRDQIGFVQAELEDELGDDPSSARSLHVEAPGAVDLTRLVAAVGSDIDADGKRRLFLRETELDAGAGEHFMAKSGQQPRDCGEVGAPL